MHEAQVAAEQRAAETAAQLLSVWRQLLPEGKQTYVFDAGVREVDLVRLNPILQRQGIEIAFQPAETSPRLVKVRVGEASWQAATRFWLQPAAPEAEAPRDARTGYLLKDIVRV